MPDSSQSPRRTSSPESIGSVLEDALTNVRVLVSAELSLARRELSSKVSSAWSSVALMAFGFMCMQAGLVALAVLLVLFSGSTWAGLVTGLALLGAGGVLMGIAWRGFQRLNLDRTSERLTDDGQRVLDAVHASTGTSS